MYENKYKNPAGANMAELEAFLQLIADLDEKIELFAIGGTAMILKNVKNHQSQTGGMLLSFTASGGF